MLVNGVPVIDDGKMTDKLPGKVLRGPGYETTMTARRQVKLVREGG